MRGRGSLSWKVLSPLLALLTGGFCCEVMRGCWDDEVDYSDFECVEYSREFCVV